MRINQVDPQCYLFGDDGVIPNNDRCPLLVYRGAVKLSGPDPAAHFERLFAANGWTDSWRNGVFPFHHYHSTAHEVLGVYAGWAEVQMGGEHGERLRIEAGDVLVVPAGVGHKKLSCDDTFGCVGAYPTGQRPDLCRGAPHQPDPTGAGPAGADLSGPDPTQPGAPERRNIRATAVPGQDPVYGESGPLRTRWS